MSGTRFGCMTVKELKEYLADKPDDAEVYASIWKSSGEVKQVVRLSNKTGNLSADGKFLRISWSDDCMADRIK